MKFLSLKKIFKKIKVTSFSIGKEKERCAVKFLKNKKYKIITTNFKCKLGEIDIIALHKETLIAVEVKYRTDSNVLPFAIHKSQEKRIHNALLYFLKCNKKYNNHKLRFDAIFINKDNNINHVENAWQSSIY